MFSKFFKHQPVAANTEEKVHVNVQSDLESSENNMVLRTEDRQRTVVNHVSIDVTQGEIVGLLGPNGAGKTTTFYMTTGLITPNQGHIYLNDLDITDYPVYKRAQIGIGYLAQEASVFRKLSVEDNIRCVLEMTHTTKEYQRDKLESLIAEFRLQKVRKNLGDQLSGGERRRTEIARCLAISPKFIMLDEPFAGVDPIAVEDIQSIVYKLKEKNISYVDVTCPFVLKIHRIVEKESLAGNHIIIIGDKDHPEVQGICGWCQGPYTVIRNKEEAEAFVPPKGKKISIVSQTTFNYNKFKDLVEILCKKRYDNNVLNILNILNTICNATEERQREAKNIAGEVDTMLVVGGRHSSNTQKLFEICKKECGNTYYIQTPVDLDSEMFQCSSCVGITAGASTPKKIIEEVQEHVRIKF